MIRFYTTNELLELKNEGTAIIINNDKNQESLKDMNYYYEQGSSEAGFCDNTTIISLRVEKMDKEIIEKMKKYIEDNNASKEQVYNFFNGTHNKEYIYNLIIEKDLI